MALTPKRSWMASATEWAEIVARYVHFRRVKAQRGRSHRADGSLNPSRLSATEAVRLRRLLVKHVDRLIMDGGLPRTPEGLRQRSIDLLVQRAGCARDGSRRPPKWLDHLWRAILLNRDRYTCPYCGRTAWDTHEQLGATLRFELDHRRAKSRLETRDDFDLRNMSIACRSCNVIKGQMNRSLFLKELQSLGTAPFVRLTRPESRQRSNPRMEPTPSARSRVPPGAAHSQRLGRMG
jgi:5-methylcytosine-specific restriction endonuclease McrA